MVTRGLVRQDRLLALAERAGGKTAADIALLKTLLHWRDAHRRAARTLAKTHTEAFDNESRSYNFLLRNGRFFEPAPRPKGIGQRAAKLCYENSLAVAKKHHLGYCEGYVLVSEKLPPVEHGWCITKGGLVVDVTLAEPRPSYFGVLFDRAYSLGHDSPLIDSVIDLPKNDCRWRPTTWG